MLHLVTICVLVVPFSIIFVLSLPYYILYDYITRQNYRRHMLRIIIIY